MKILYICADTGIDVLGRKGAAIHVREMISAFARMGHDVDLVAPRLMKSGPADANGERPRASFPPAEVAATIHRVPVPDDVQAVKRQLDMWTERFESNTSLPKDIRRMLYDEHLHAQLASKYSSAPPDLIYARASLLSTAGVDLSRSTGAPLVLEVNAPLADEQQEYRSGGLADLYRSAERELFTGAAHIVVVSESLVSYVRSFDVDPSRIHVLPNGVDVNRFRPRCDRKHRPTEPPIRTEAAPVLGFVGGLRPWHGVEYLPQVLKLVQRQFPKASLQIAGEGPLRSTIVENAEQLGVVASVNLLGAVQHDAVAEIVRGFDVALAPYPELDHQFYFSPLKLFEYFASGVPVVASDVGQIAQLISANAAQGSAEVAILTPPGDPVAMAAACCALLNDRKRAYEMGIAGAALVREHFTWDHNAKRVIGLVEANQLCASHQAVMR
jgi:glycosyltransferase involved in cell wall biosynthesis